MRTAYAYSNSAREDHMASAFKAAKKRHASSAGYMLCDSLFPVPTHLRLFIEAGGALHFPPASLPRDRIPRVVWAHSAYAKKCTLGYKRFIFAQLIVCNQVNVMAESVFADKSFRKDGKNGIADSHAATTKVTRIKVDLLTQYKS